MSEDDFVEVATGRVSGGGNADIFGISHSLRLALMHASLDWIDLCRERRYNESRNVSSENPEHESGGGIADIFEDSHSLRLAI
eukprot:2666395-Karenia_brevis.AAC.1